MIRVHVCKSARVQVQAAKINVGDSMKRQHEQIAAGHQAGHIDRGRREGLLEHEQRKDQVGRIRIQSSHTFKTLVWSRAISIDRKNVHGDVDDDVIPYTPFVSTTSFSTIKLFVSRYLPVPPSHLSYPGITLHSCGKYSSSPNRKYMSDVII